MNAADLRCLRGTGAVVCLAWLCHGSPALAGPEWVEDKDAGDTIFGAQATLGEGAIASIRGRLDDAALRGAADFEDVYVIRITNPNLFSASTVVADGGETAFDSRLYLFDVDGFGLLANDDVSGLDTASAFANSSDDGTDIDVMDTGIYLIAISTAMRRPESFTGDIFDFATLTEVSGPDGGGAANPLAGWSDFPLRGTPGPGEYVIALTGAEFAGPNVRISEIRIDQPGPDFDEYFELRGTPDVNLDALTYITVRTNSPNNSGAIRNVFSLVSNNNGADGYFVVADDSFSLGSADVQFPLSFSSTENVTHLLVSGFTGSLLQDLDTNDDGVIDVLPWDFVHDRIALIEEDNPPSADDSYHYGPPTIGPDGAGFVPAQVYYCQLTGTWVAGAFDPTGGTDTPHAANAPCPQCDADIIDGNGVINVFDLLELLSNWNSNGPGAAIAPPEDVVNVFDLLELLAAWGPC